LSVIRTSFLSYSCFFLLLVEVELLLKGEGVEGGSGNNKEGSVTDSLSTILRLLGEELEEASWLI